LTVRVNGIQNAEFQGHTNYAIQLKQDHRVGDWKLTVFVLRVLL